MLAADRIAMEKWLAERAKDPHKELHYTGSGATVGDVERWIRALLKTERAQDRAYWEEMPLLDEAGQ